MPLEDQGKDGMPPADGGSNDEHSPDQQQQQQSDSDPLSSSGEGENLRKRARQNSPGPGPSHGGLSGLAASPHKHKTFGELLAAASIVGNMALAHEIVVDGNFKLSPRELPENSVEKQVKDIMHKAFWDSLREQLSDDPPSYTHAITLVGEIREILLSLLLPHHDKLKTQILEGIDLDLLKQQAEHNALDVTRLALFIIDIMSKLCAPVRDEEIAKLGTLTDTVDLFKEIFRVLDLMKVDMANFTLQSLRPHLQQQSIQYERKKFQEFLSTQQDGLQFTRKWLEDAAAELSEIVRQQQQQQQQQQQNEGQGSSEGGGANSRPVNHAVTSPTAILNYGYVNLLHRDPNDVTTFPETVLMDRGRLCEMGLQVQKLTLIGSVLLVTFMNTGNLLSGIQGFPSKLKHNLYVLLDGVSDFTPLSDNVADQVSKEVNECLKEHGFPEFDALRTEALKSQVKALFNKENNIYKILDSRVRRFLINAIAAPSSFDPSTNIPPGLSTMQSQLLESTKAFVRLVVHNRSVFGPYYAEILSNMVQPQTPQ